MYRDLVWNTDTQRLEFTDGEPVGHRTVEQARDERDESQSADDSEEPGSTRRA